MKRAVFFLGTVLSCSVAQACIGEAQVIADIQACQSVDSETDRVYLNPGSVKLYQENPSCPLELKEVLEKGIEARSNCFHHGSTLSGTVVKDQDGRLILK